MNNTPTPEETPKPTETYPTEADGHYTAYATNWTKPTP